MNTSETEVSADELDLLRQTVENADNFSPEESRSILKSLGTRFLEVIGISKAVATDAKPKKKDEEDADPEDAVQDTAVPAAPEMSANDLDDANAPDAAPAATPAEPEAPAAAPDFEAGTDDAASGEPDDEAKKGKKIKKSVEGEDFVEVDGEEEPLYNVEAIMNAMYGAVLQSNEYIQKSLERDEAKDRVIQKSLEDDSEISNLKIQVNDLGDKITGLTDLFGEVRDIVKSIQFDRASAPIGQPKPKEIEKSLGDGSEPVGQSAPANLQGVGQRVQEVEISKAVVLENEPVLRHGINEGQFRRNLFIALDDPELRNQFNVDKAIHETVIKKSFDAPDIDSVIEMVAAAMKKYPHVAK